MKSSKKIMSLALAGSMIIGSASAALAAPTHIIVKNKAFSVQNLINDGYKNEMEKAVAESQGKVYIADNDGKTVQISDFLTGNYATDYANAPNLANDIVGDVKVVNGDLTEGEAIQVPGQDNAQKEKCETLFYKLAA